MAAMGLVLKGAVVGLYEPSVWGINASHLLCYTYALSISGLTLSSAILTGLLRYSTQLGVLFSDNRIIAAEFSSFPVGGELVYAKSVHLSRKQIGEGFLGKSWGRAHPPRELPWSVAHSTGFSPAKL